MNLLGHWVCENCDSVDPPTFKGDEKACGVCADEGENGLLVNLVPASQLRGAVEALRLIREHARLDHAERGIAEAERYVVIADEALSHLGGR